MGGPSGNLVDVMGDRDRRDGCGRHDLHRSDQLLATAEIESCGGFVEEYDGGFAHKSASEEYPLTLTAREGSEAPMGQGPDAESTEQVGGSAPVLVGVSVPPGLKRPMERGHDDVGGREFRSE